MLSCSLHPISRTWIAIGLLLCGLSAAACVKYELRTYEIRQRAFAHDPSRLWGDYHEEYEFIANRRATLLGKAKQTGTGVPPHLTGLAFSGGGIRSATFHLGVLQAVQELDQLKQIDYLSTVSGGSYVGGWMAAHLGSDQDDDLGYLIETKDPNRLLNEREDFIAHLRDRSGFIQEGGFFEGPKLIWSYLWRLPLYVVWDLGLHIKTVPTIGNELHLFNPYRDRIELTYMRGKEKSPLSHVNRNVISPYLVVNGNLVNRGRPRGYVGDKPYFQNYNFEFTHDFSGSDGLGYVRTPGFGRPVVQVLDKDKQLAWGSPAWVVVEDPPGAPCDMVPQADAAKGAPCARFSEAMTISGAALDIDSLLAESYTNDFTRTLMRFASAPFNLNFEYQTWNFARRYNDFFGTIWDYLVMMTWRRLSGPNTVDRWIEITDGSFFDNTGAYALLRRGVSHVMVGDATLDKEWTYHYLKVLRKRLRNYYGDKAQWCGEFPEDHEIVWHRKFWLKRGDGTTAAIHFIKPYAYNPALFKANTTLTRAGTPFLSLRPEPKRDLTKDPLTDLKYPTHLDPKRIVNLATKRKEAEEIERAIARVVKFAGTPKTRSLFAQTDTYFQWYSTEEFEAYRLLGYLMAKTYFADITFDDESLKPAGGCESL